MSKRQYKIAPQYLRGEQRRQRYLDFLHQNPGSTAQEIQQHMSAAYGDNVKTNNTTRQLLALGEISAIKSGGLWRYTAIVTTTTPAADMSIKQRAAAKIKMDARHGNEATALNDKGAPNTLGSPLYVHKSGFTRNSGGQGALRERTCIGSTAAGMVW